MNPPRHLTDALIAYLRATPDAPPALLITADGVRRVRLEAVCPHCGLPVGQAGPHGACAEYAGKGAPWTSTHPRTTTP